MIARLRDALLIYDGVTISQLSDVDARFSHSASYLNDLTALSGDREAHIGAGATWLLKDYLDRGVELDSEQSVALIRHLRDDMSWAAALHILQSVRHLDVSLADEQSIADHMTALTTHDRPFVRAWAVDAIYRLAKAHAHFRSQADTALKTALIDPAASVRARARKLQKEFPA